jgi:hypothetical protein
MVLATLSEQPGRTMRMSELGAAISASLSRAPTSPPAWKHEGASPGSAAQALGAANATLTGAGYANVAAAGTSKPPATTGYASAARLIVECLNPHAADLRWVLGTGRSGHPEMTRNRACTFQAADPAIRGICGPARRFAAQAPGLVVHSFRGTPDPDIVCVSRSEYLCDLAALRTERHRSV